MKSIEMFDISFTAEKTEFILKYLEKYLKNERKNTGQTSEKWTKPVSIVTPNPEQVVYARHHRLFSEILVQADIAVPDGVGIMLASRMLSRRAIRRPIPGVLLLQRLAVVAEKNAVRIGLIGGVDGVAVDALECLQKSHPHLEGEVVGCPSVEIRDENSSFEVQNSRYEGEDIEDENAETRNKRQKLQTTDRLSHHFHRRSISPISKHTQMNMHADDIREQVRRCIRIDGEVPDKYIKSRANYIKSEQLQIVFVGLGVPKQEYVMYLLREELIHQEIDFPVILMAVGGSFDEISGRLPTPPDIISHLGLKWLWRLILQPARWRRQLALVEFVYLVVRAGV